MSTLLPGVRFISAPRFHIEGSLSERLSLNSGITIIENQMHPQPDWRPPTSAELEISTTNAAPTDTIQLFNITERLHAEWWALASESSD
jgi:hypothetical protein